MRKKEAKIFYASGAFLWRGELPYLLSGLFIAASVAFTLYRMQPPEKVGTTAGPEMFSSARAMQQLEKIAEYPHPSGSKENAAVRDYILQQLRGLGLNPEVQTTTPGNPPVESEPLSNVVVQLPGSSPEGKLLMLTAHYDSVPNGPGASDDGSGVVVLLETLRALKAGPQLKNNVVFLFSDGEENGLQGAKLFMKQHRWAKEVGLVLNFEARGNSGPVIMFETSDQNGWLIKEFAKAAPRPVASSLMYDFYRTMANNTDLTVYKRAGLSGLNFAYLRGVTYYHTPYDNLRMIDERSVQHGGLYALALTRHFSKLNLGAAYTPPAIYFDVLGLTLISYSAALVLPITVVVLALLSVVFILGLRSHQLSLSGLLLGSVLFIASLGCSLGVSMLVWLQLQSVHSLAAPQQLADLFLVSLAALLVATTSSLYLFFFAIGLL